MATMQTAAQAYYMADSAEGVALALESCALADIADQADAMAATQLLRLWAAVINAGERPGPRICQALEQLADHLELFLARQPDDHHQRAGPEPDRAHHPDNFTNR